MLAGFSFEGVKAFYEDGSHHDAHNLIGSVIAALAIGANLAKVL